MEKNMFLLMSHYHVGTDLKKSPPAKKPLGKKRDVHINLLFMSVQKLIDILFSSYLFQKSAFDMNKESHIYNISSCNRLHMFVFDKNKERLMTFMNVYTQ